MFSLWHSRILVDKRLFYFVLLLFVVLRLPALLLPVTPTSDAAWYVNRALGIAQGIGYSEIGLPTAYWPVGYPGFLAGLFALLGPNLLVVKLSNLLFGAITLVLMYLLCRRCFADERVGIVAALIYAVYPNQIAYTAVPLTEILFSFLLIFGIAIFVFRPGGLLAGAVFGLATLIKAQTILFPIFLLAGYGWTHRRQLSLVRFSRLSLAMYATCFLVIAPWTLRNYLVFGDFILVSTNGGIAFYTGNFKNATGGYLSESDLPAQFRPEVADQVAIDRRAKAAALGWIEANPGGVLALVPAKIWKLWAPDGEGEWWFEGGYAGYDDHQTIFKSLRVLNQACYATIVLLYACSLLSMMNRNSTVARYAYLGVAVVAHTTLVSIAFTGQSRFHFPAMPWLIMYASWFLVAKFTNAPAHILPRGVGRVPES